MNTSEHLQSLVRRLIRLPSETEWLEFKVDNANPEEIGRNISALANAAAINGKERGYIIWGVHDVSKEAVGTRFRPLSQMVGNEPLEAWAHRLIDPKINFKFSEVALDGKDLVILEVPCAYHHPVRFKSVEYVRVGSVTKNLKDTPDRESALWKTFDRRPFEHQLASEMHTGAEILDLLEFGSYFRLTERPLPASRGEILSLLAGENLIRRNEAGTWDITNLGAILFAADLENFFGLKRKAARVIQYRGVDRTQTIREQVGTKGYAVGFEGLVKYVNDLLPSNEVVGQALRRTARMFPAIAVRELVANALIHQDLVMSGSGPMIEIFEDRVEFSNPGSPLIDIERFVDSPPRSRNENLASLARRLGICEERGSGIDKVVAEVEISQLPAPLFESHDGFTRTVLFAHKELRDMAKNDRVRACYLHACLQYVTKKIDVKCIRTSKIWYSREKFGASIKTS